MSRLRLQLVLLAITAIISTSWAQDNGSLNLTLTAKEAVKLYIDGVLHDLPNERNVSATDTIAVSRTSRLLAFQCINLLPTCPGIIASITGDYFLSNASWKCFEISGGETWTDLGFDDSHWPNATEHRPNNNQTDGIECSTAILPYVPSISENAFWVWMEDTVQDIIYCRAYLPVCSSSPCQNGATCNVNEVAQCTCVGGYTGYYCETEINECDSGPCVNGATCQDSLNAFECSCAAGYTGIRCETDVQECDSTPCLNNGTCEELNVNGYQCICPANYTGYNCESKVDDCLSIPCQNNGTCVANNSDDSGYICLCPIGFTGSNCESVPTMTLIITADRSLTSFYVDNVEYDLRNGSSWAAPDHIAIPESSGLIAVRATNAVEADCSGILGSIGSAIVTNTDWKCSTDNTLGWYRTDYDDSHWPQAVTYDSNISPFLCQYRHQIQEISPSANWIWTNDTSVSMNCRLQLVPLTLIITADRSLLLLYVDNIEYRMRNGSSWAAPDHIAIPASSSLIALRASNTIEADCSGILGSIGSAIVTNADWKCSTDNTLGWYRTDYDDSHWPQAITYDSNISPFLCQYRHQIQEISPSANWIWTNDTSVSMNCRLQLA